MTLPLRSLIAANQQAKRLASQELPVVLAYRLARALKAIRSEVDDYDGAQNDLIARYGEDTPAGKSINAGMSGWSDFAREVTALQDQEVEVTVKPVRFALLLDSGATLTAQEIEALDDIVIEGVDAALDALDNPEEPA